MCILCNFWDIQHYIRCVKSLKVAPDNRWSMNCYQSFIVNVAMSCIGSSYLKLMWYCDFEIQVRGYLKSLKMASFSRSIMSSYWHSIITMDDISESNRWTSPLHKALCSIGLVNGNAKVQLKLNCIFLREAIYSMHTSSAMCSARNALLNVYYFRTWRGIIRVGRNEISYKEDMQW